MHTERLAGGPKGTPEGRAPKGPKRGPEGATAAAGCQEVLAMWEGCLPPPENPPNLFSPTIIPEEAAGRQGVLEGGGGVRTVPHTQKIPPIFFTQNYLRSGSKPAKPPGGAGRGVGRGCLVGVQRMNASLYNLTCKSDNSRCRKLGKTQRIE